MIGAVLRYFLGYLAICGVHVSVLRKENIIWNKSSNTPTLKGPGFECDKAFAEDVLTLDTLLLCNKTASTKHFNKTEIQTLNTAVLRLGEGECEQFQGKGFRCKEHYDCLSDSTLITDGTSTTQIISLVTTVSVHTSVPGATTFYSYSILDATDRKCETYTKVCCGPKEGANEPFPINPRIVPTVTEPTKPKCNVSGIVNLGEDSNCEDEEEVKRTSTKVDKIECHVSDIVILRDGLKCKDKEVTTIENPCKGADESSVLRCNLLPPTEVEIRIPSPRPAPPSDYVPQCGRHNPKGYRQSLVNLDQSLHESQFGEWPNMCAILEKGVYKCGASLISPNFLLTAAHCFDSSIASPGTIVRCGDWDTLTDAELYPFQERGVRQVVFHPGFDTERGARGNLRNDIAVIQTDKAFLLAPHVDTICLPKPGENFDGSLCAATGWGKDRFGDDVKSQVILKEVWMKVIEQKNCQEKLRKTKLGEFFVLDESFICAGGEVDIDMCTGDGGSPLMCEGSDGFVQAGIVSWGVACGLNDVPGVYVDISKYVCWIKTIVEEIEGTNYFPYSDECGLDGNDYDIRQV